MAIDLTKAPRKPRTRKPKPSTLNAIESALERLINPPAFVCGSTRTISDIDWNVTLFSDDTIAIVTTGGLVASGRFVTSVERSAYGYSVSANIIDVIPSVSADILRALSSDLTYFAMRAGRFAGVRS